MKPLWLFNWLWQTEDLYFFIQADKIYFKISRPSFNSYKTSADYTSK